MNEFDTFRKVTERRREQDSQTDRQRFIDRMKKKLQTSFIGAISCFEDTFGENWGHGLTEDECTDKQLDMRTVWNNCRNDILNNGNDQLRAFLKEIDSVDIKYHGARINFKLGGN